ncbi:MAG: hypothetical protein AB7K52_14805 [Phycisphaerales bacterium]
MNANDIDRLLELEHALLHAEILCAELIRAPLHPSTRLAPTVIDLHTTLRGATDHVGSVLIEHITETDAREHVRSIVVPPRP